MTNLLILLAICYSLVSIGAACVLISYEPRTHSVTGVCAALCVGFTWLPVAIVNAVRGWRECGKQAFRCSFCQKKLLATSLDLEHGQLSCKHCGSQYCGSLAYGFGNAHGGLESWDSE